MEKLNRVISKIISTSPFYAYFLMGTKIEEAPVRGLKITVNPKGDLCFLYNPIFIATKNDKILEGLIFHELLHLINRHYLIKSKNKKEKILLDMAKDAAINQVIPILYAYTIPLDVLINEMHRVDNDLIFVGPPDFMPNRTAEEYFEFALEQISKNSSVDYGTLEKLANKLPENGSEEIEEIYLELFEEKTGKAFNLFGKDLPSGLVKELEIILSKSEINWTEKLRRCVGLSNKSDRYATPLRPNRRYLDQPGWRYTYEPSIAVIVDTSGSILDEELNAFLGEIESISKSGIKIKMIQVDSNITLVSDYYAGKWKNLEIRGGGETDLQPAVDLAQNFRSEVIIIFTDGYVDVPLVKRRVLFVLSKNHNKEFYEEVKERYGSVVVLKR